MDATIPFNHVQELVQNSPNGLDGLKTTIGTISGQRTWSQIEAVEKVQDKIVIFGKNGNGFIVPSRAFKNTNEADTFFKVGHGISKKLEFTNLMFQVSNSWKATYPNAARGRARHARGNQSAASRRVGKT